ncbi:MAG: ATP-grasp domain-containing protein, partial [Planctomycetota bacterium]
MKIFVGEFVCGGGYGALSFDEMPVGMKQEGEAMLAAFIDDLNDFAESTVVLDTRFEAVDASRIIPYEADKPLWGQWAAAAKGCDAAIIIAPEQEGILAKSAAVLRGTGIDVVAGSGDFLRVASDKLLTAQVLHSSGICHPPYIAVDDDRMIGVLAGYEKFVVKPRDGCGTQDLKTFRDFREARKSLKENDIMQGWVQGQPVSIALLSSGSYQTFLPAVSQNIIGANCEYRGGCGPLDDALQRRAAAIASRAVAAMPPTARGFVGLDLILGDVAGDDYVI